MRDSVAADLADVSSSQTTFADKDSAEAVFALVSLGISQTDAAKIVGEISKTVDGAENIIREALKRL